MKHKSFARTRGNDRINDASFGGEWKEKHHDVEEIVADRQYLH